MRPHREGPAREGFGRRSWRRGLRGVSRQGRARRRCGRRSPCKGWAPSRPGRGGPLSDKQVNSEAILSLKTPSVLENNGFWEKKKKKIDGRQQLRVRGESHAGLPPRGGAGLPLRAGSSQLRAKSRGALWARSLPSLFDGGGARPVSARPEFEALTVETERFSVESFLWQKEAVCASTGRCAGPRGLSPQSGLPRSCSPRAQSRSSRR